MWQPYGFTTSPQLVPGPPIPFSTGLVDALDRDNATVVAKSIRVLLRAAATGRTLKDIHGGTVQVCVSGAASKQDVRRLKGPGGFCHLLEAVRLFQQYRRGAEDLPPDLEEFIPKIDGSRDAIARRIACDVLADRRWPPWSVTQLVNEVIANSVATTVGSHPIVELGQPTEPPPITCSWPDACQAIRGTRDSKAVNAFKAACRRNATGGSKVEPYLAPLWQNRVSIGVRKHSPRVDDVEKVVRAIKRDA
jgi:hypothetical protein